MTWVIFYLTAFTGLVVLSGIFSSTETAYTSLTFHQLKRIQRIFPGSLSLWEQGPDRVLATLLLSNNSVNTAAGVLAAVMASDVARTLGWRSSILSLLFGFLAGCVILVFGEIIPKVMGQRSNVAWALGITPLMRRWTSLISPFARLASWLANILLLRLTRRAPPTPFLNRTALRRIMIHARIPTSSHGLINSVMEFSRMTVKDIWKPRSEIIAVSLNMPLERVVQNVIQSGYSRVPIYRNGIDDIVGHLLAKDLLVAWRSGTLVVFHDLLRPMLTVHSGMPLPDLLRLFRARRQHMAIVRHPVSGRVEGLTTLQDACAALVGDIKEED